MAPGTPSWHVRLGAAVALLLGVLALLGASPPEPSPSVGVVRVGIYGNPPKVFVSQAGEPAGLFVDLLEAVARQEGWRLQYVPGTFAEGLDRVQRGEIDLMPDVARISSRERTMAFSEVGVLSSWSQVYARRGTGIRSVLDLKGRKVAVLEGSVQQEGLRRLTQGFGLPVTLVSVPDYDSAFAIAAAGGADAAVTNRFYGVLHARQAGLEDTAVVFDPSEIYVAAPPGDPKGLLRALDRHLQLWKAEQGSEYYRALNRWLSEEVPFRFPGWIRVVLFAGTLVLLGSMAGSFLLSRQVKARTRELQEANREMERKVEERTAELAAAKARAEAADRMKSSFLSTMSHEFRTPLNSVIGFSGILEQGLAGPLNEEQGKQIRMIRTSAEHLLELINDVLDLSKIEAGQLRVSVELFPLRKLVDHVIATLAPQAARKGLALVVEVAPDVGDLASDRCRVEQILLNLVGNAIKFTDRGGVTVTAAREGDALRLSVRDTGMGIQAEDLGRLFQPFRQLDSGLARNHEGTGLGLAICRRLSELLGGQILAESEPGVGSTFTVLLPLEGGVPCAVASC